MSKQSQTSLKPADRPFARKICQRAAAIAQAYQVIMQFEDGEYFGHCFELPNVMGDGATPDKCVESTRQALGVAVAYLLEEGLPLPPSANEK